MLKISTLVSLLSIAFVGSCFASELDSSMLKTKKAVRDSLWYEGMSPIVTETKYLKILKKPLPEEIETSLYLLDN